MEISNLNSISYEQFQKFIDSLDEEKNTWSLDLQNMKNSKDYFESQSKDGNFVLLDGDKVGGLFLATPSYYENINILHSETIRIEDNSIDNIKYKTQKWIYSYVIKKEYQRKSFATRGLMELIKLKSKISRENWDVEIIIHAARTHTYNLGSRFLLKKLGFSSGHKDGNQITYYLVENGINNKKVNIKSMYDSDLIGEK